MNGISSRLASRIIFLTSGVRCCVPDSYCKSMPLSLSDLQNSLRSDQCSATATRHSYRCAFAHAFAEKQTRYQNQSDQVDIVEATGRLALLLSVLSSND